MVSFLGGGGGGGGSSWSVNKNPQQPVAPSAENAGFKLPCGVS